MTTRPSAAAEVLFVDTCVWSLAFRRDQPADEPAVAQLRQSLTDGRDVVITGLILQELLQGMRGPRQRSQLIDRFAALRSITPDRRDHIDASEVRNSCRRSGLQVGTVGALIVALCVRHDLTLLSTDADFRHAANVVPLRLWAPDDPAP